MFIPKLIGTYYMYINSKHTIYFNNMLIQTYRHYSTTILLTPSYSLGASAGLFLGIQIITGFFLASHYVPTTHQAFEVIHSNLMRDLDSGWLLRHLHANGASFFFIAVYAHMFRGLYHGSPSKTRIWLVGVIIYILLSGICFTGYSLVYGQMSLWAIVVICSLVTAIPYIGQDLLILIWGNSVVSTCTLQRVFCVHFLLPIVLALFAMLHIAFLHEVNSTGEYPIIQTRSDRINLFPLLLVRDALILSLFSIAYCYFVFFNPDVLGHADNYVPANPMVTPPEIMPEFYFLPVYAIVRAIPHKAIGILGMVFVFFSLSNILPSIGSKSELTQIASMNSVRWWTGSGSPTAVTPLSRALLFVFLLDVLLACKLCLMVNHFESMYWLLIITVLGMFSAELGRSNS